MKPRAYEPLNDGLLEYGTIKTVRDANNKIDKTADPFNKVGDLFFNFMNTRQGDYEQYGGKTQIVDEKVKTYFDNGVQKSHKVRIEGVEYDITAIDPDANRIFMYWYLTKVGEAQYV